jgi:hypothetical protein
MNKDIMVVELKGVKGEKCLLKGCHGGPTGRYSGRYSGYSGHSGRGGGAGAGAHGLELPK